MSESSVLTDMPPNGVAIFTSSPLPLLLLFDSTRQPRVRAAGRMPSSKKVADLRWEPDILCLRETYETTYDIARWTVHGIFQVLPQVHRSSSLAVPAAILVGKH